MAMSKWGRRTLGAVLGVVLGWAAAGMMPTSLHAENSHGHASAPAESSSPVHSPAAPHAVVESETARPDAGQNAAAMLVPPASQVPWLQPVLMSVGGLFALAVVVGLMNRHMGLRDPAVVAAESDQAAAHGHDDHGKGTADHAHGSHGH